MSIFIELSSHRHTRCIEQGKGITRSVQNAPLAAKLTKMITQDQGINFIFVFEKYILHCFKRHRQNNNGEQDIKLRCRSVHAYTVQCRF